MQDQIAFLDALTACPAQLSATADMLLSHNTVLEKTDIADSLSDTIHTVRGTLTSLLKVAGLLKSRRAAVIVLTYYLV